MSVLCRDLVLDIVESLTVYRIFSLAFVGVVDAAKERPEGRSRRFTNEPRSSVASELEHARFESTQAELLVLAVRIYFAQHVLIALRIGHCVSICSVHLQNRFNDLK